MKNRPEFDALESRLVCDGAPATIDDLSLITGVPPSQISGQPSPPPDPGDLPHVGTGPLPIIGSGPLGPRPTITTEPYFPDPRLQDPGVSPAAAPPGFYPRPDLIAPDELPR
jgi:hypothetical protein